MMRSLAGMIVGMSLGATSLLAQTTSTVLSGEATGFAVMDSTTPDPFSFDAEVDVEPDGIDVTSNTVTISGITEPVMASVSDLGTGGDPRISVQGGTYTTGPVQVVDGDSLLVAILPEQNVFGETYQAEVTIGGGSAIFEVTTRNADTTPEAFSFLAADNQEPATVVASAPATITGLEAPAAVSVAGDGAPELSFDSGSTWVASGEVAENGTVSVRLTSGTFGEVRTATVTIGGVDGTFSVTTRSSNDTPVFADFTDLTGVEPGVTETSDAVTVTGIETSVIASVTGDGLPELQVNDGPWIPVGDTAAVVSNDTVRLRLTSGAFGTTRTATLDVNGVTQDFAVTTRTADTTPDAFTIASVTDAQANSLVQSSTTISGIDAPTTVSIAGDGNPEFSTDGGNTWTDVNGSGSVENEGTILVRLTSGTFDITRTATLTVGGVDGVFSVTTASQDTTPDAFGFGSAVVVGGTVGTSGVVTLAGFDGSVAISVSGDGSPEYRIGTDPWTNVAGTVAAGQDVQVRLTASNTEGVSRIATLSVGSGSGTFTVETQDLTPDALAFSAVTGAALSATVTSEAIQVSGITGAVPVSIVEGNGALFRIGTGPDVDTITWGSFLDHTESGATVSNAGWVQVRLTASGSYETEVSTTLSVGNGSAGFSVTTGSEPVSITISSGSVPDAERDQAYAGFDFTTFASVSGGSSSSPPTVNDLTWSVTGGALPAGMSLSAAGNLTGTPTEVGSFGFTAQAELGGETAAASYTIIVNDPDGSLVIEGG